MINISAIERKLFLCQCAAWINVKLLNLITPIISNCRKIEELDNPNILYRIAYYMLEFLMYVFVIPVNVVREMMQRYAKSITWSMMKQLEAELKATEELP